MSQDWNPQLYTRFEDERTRPAAELLARVPALPHASSTVVDLGCGPGNSTALLVQRFAQARVVGVDNSPAMLAAAHERLPQLPLLLADIADQDQWLSQLSGAAGVSGAAVLPGLIYANAALQWVPHHAQLVPALMQALTPGGVLAIQMPDNWNEPSHRLMREVAARPAYAAYTAQSAREPLLGIGAYYDLLAPFADHLDVWHTVYQHRMSDAAAIVQWLSSTGLRPFVDPMPEAVKTAFLRDYQAELAHAYPVRQDGCRLLAFPRLFLVARRAA
jgi:trans-aconitate 2-methyltransferase